MSFELALVTGAGGGLGSALCKLLASKGIAVLPINRIDADLAKRQERNRILALIEQRVPDLIINNAGFTVYGDSLFHPRQTEMDILEVNAVALLEISLTAASALRKKNRSGVILNISSAAYEYSFPKMAVYAASKAFATSFSKSFDAELRPYNIRVLVSLPGQINTEFANKAAAKQVKGRRAAMNPEYVAQKIWKQIEQRKQIQIIDWRYRLLKLASMFVPRRLVERSLNREILRRLNQ